MFYIHIEPEITCTTRPFDMVDFNFWEVDSVLPSYFPIVCGGVFNVVYTFPWCGLYENETLAFQQFTSLSQFTIEIIIVRESYVFGTHIYYGKSPLI